MNPRRMLIWSVLWGVVLAGVGCTDPMLGLGQPSAEPVLGLATQPTSRPSVRAARRSRSEASNPSRDGMPAGDTFTLYLVRDASQIEAGPYTKVVVLRRAVPDQAVWFMDWLTEPSGHAGATDRQFLLYADPVVLEWAADVAAMGDVYAADSGSRTQPAGGDGLSRAISSLYGQGGPAGVSRSAAESLAADLDGYCDRPGDPHRRWAGCMLAGGLREEVLGRRDQAGEAYGRAAGLVHPSSPAWLISRCRQAQALLAAGRRDDARAVAEEVIRQCGSNYSQVPAYQQIEKIVSP